MEEEERVKKIPNIKEIRRYSASHFQSIHGTERWHALIWLLHRAWARACFSKACVCARALARGEETGGRAAHTKASPGRGTRWWDGTAEPGRVQGRLDTPVQPCGSNAVFNTGLAHRTTPASWLLLVLHLHLLLPFLLLLLLTELLRSILNGVNSLPPHTSGCRPPLPATFLSPTSSPLPSPLFCRFSAPPASLRWELRVLEPAGWGARACASVYRL